MCQCGPVLKEPDHCGPCNCPNRRSAGSKLPCACPEGQKPVKAETIGHYCCKASRTKNHKWPEPCEGRTLTSSNKLSFQCGDDVEKNCGQCVDGKYQHYEENGVLKSCCCNERPDK